MCLRQRARSTMTGLYVCSFHCMCEKELKDKSKFQEHLKLSAKLMLQVWFTRLNESVK